MTRFLDANVIVKAFTDNEDKEECRNLLHEEFITNTLCLVEAHYSIAIITSNGIYAANSIKSLFKGNSTIIELDKNLLFEALKRIEKYNLNVFDLIHYTTALLNNCSEFVSFDRHFDGLEIKRTEP